LSPLSSLGSSEVREKEGREVELSLLVRLLPKMNSKTLHVSYHTVSTEGESKERTVVNCDCRISRGVKKVIAG